MLRKNLIFTCYSFKGGSGKTVLSTNLSYYLSQVLGGHTLLVDGDSPAPSLHKLFTPPVPSEKLQTFVDLVGQYPSVEEVDIEQLSYPTQYENLDVVYAVNPQLGAGSLSRKAHSFWVNALKVLFRCRDAWLKNYDYVVIDNQSGVTMNSVNNITVSNIGFLMIRPVLYGVSGTEHMRGEVVQSVKHVTRNLWPRNDYLVWNQVPHDPEDMEMNTEVAEMLEEWAQYFENLPQAISSVAKIHYSPQLACSMMKGHSSAFIGLSEQFQMVVAQLLDKVMEDFPST